MKVSPVAGDQIDQTVAIEAINHNIEREGLWLTTYTCRPVTTQESQGYWVLGTSDLDTETRLA